MRKLPAILTICVVACGVYLAAQDEPTSPQPQYTAAEMRMRIAGLNAVCALANGTERRMDQTVVVDGITYRCTVVLDEHLRPTGVAWTRMVSQP